MIGGHIGKPIGAPIPVAAPAGGGDAGAYIADRFKKSIFLKSKLFAVGN